MDFVSSGIEKPGFLNRRRPFCRPKQPGFRNVGDAQPDVVAFDLLTRGANCPAG
jgi:hypothetical protein